MRPVPVTQQTIKLEYPFMVLACWIMLLLSRDGLVDRLEGAFFLVSLVAFIVYMVRIARVDVLAGERAQLEREVAGVVGKRDESASPPWVKSILLVLVGIVGLALGADLMVRGATTIATTLGITQSIIGLTVIAMGTSLPELATSIVAARRGDSAIALGNVVGSNIFNVLAILGVTSFIFPVPVNPEAIRIDNWVMLGFVVVLFPVMLIGKKVTRRDAVAMLLAFSVYMVVLFANL